MKGSVYMWICFKCINVT